MAKIFLFVFILLPSVVAARPSLLIEWRYNGTVPIEKFVLSRGEEGRMPRPYVDLSPTTNQLIDNAVKKQKIYCYNLRAVSASGISSDTTATICAQPRR